MSTRAGDATGRWKLLCRCMTESKEERGITQLTGGYAR
jgi:hypothetical protein